MNLAELARAATSREVQICGEKVMLRGMAGWETNRIRSAMPQPAPPQIPDPDKGSASTATVPNAKDPVFLAQVEDDWYRFRLACVGAATGHETKPLGSWDAVRGAPREPADFARIRAWCDAVTEELAHLPLPLVAGMYRSLVEASMPTTAASLEAAEKN